MDAAPASHRCLTCRAPAEATRAGACDTTIQASPPHVARAGRHAPREEPLMPRMTWRLATIALLSIGSMLVSYAPAHATPDGWITTRVKIALMTSHDVRAMPINVDTNDGNVTLHGTVRDRAERVEAERVAMR